MSGETLHPVRSDQHDEHTGTGHMRLDLLEPLHSPVKRAVVKEHILGAEPLLEPEVKRPRSARHLGMAITNEDLQRPFRWQVNRNAGSTVRVAHATRAPLT